MKNISFKEGEGKRVKVKKKQLLSMLIAWEKNLTLVLAVSLCRRGNLRNFSGP